MNNKRTNKAMFNLYHYKVIQMHSLHRYRNNNHQQKIKQNNKINNPYNQLLKLHYKNHYLNYSNLY